MLCVYVVCWYFCKLFKLIFAYRQTVWTLIRLLQAVRQKRLLKSQAGDKADTIVVTGSLKIKKIDNF